jgi:hypothetical protein
MGSGTMLRHYPFFYLPKTTLMLSPEQIQKINQNISENKFKQREERYMYLGILSEYQLHMNNYSNEIVYTKLNPHQHFLFKRVLHGLKVYSQEDISKMHWDKKRRIKKVWIRGQKEINIWKQTICNKNINNFLRLFYNSKLIKEIIDIPTDEINEHYKNNISFKDLNIKYEDVILFYMSKGLLPRNFIILK